MSTYIIFGSIFITVFMFSVTIMNVLRQKTDNYTNKLHDIKSYQSRYQPKAIDITKPAIEKDKKISPKIEKIITSVGQLYSTNEEKLSKIRKSLLYAGYRKEQHLRNYIGIRISSAIVFTVLYIYLGIISNRMAGSFFTMIPLMTLMGYLLPQAFLNAQIRKRQEQIGSSLADALDLLVTCVEAGMGLNAAILKVGQELHMRCKQLSEEFILVNQEMRTGFTREKALRNLSDRNKIQDLRILVSAIIMADRMGSSIAQTLRTHSDSLRTRIRQRVEEQAAKAGIKMLFPLVLFILPALMIVMLGPGFLQIMRTFNETPK
ncbi:type II secretion system F family protein [candidate division KSB1 bacterium]|nr:type II secretion system F family protein [candidate division KSB1 bacterium]